MCECQVCKECGGTGTVWVDFYGDYLGRNRCDDMDEVIDCPECEGSGLFCECDECRIEFEEMIYERATGEEE